MSIELAYPCGHTITVEEIDPRFIFGAQEAKLVADIVLHCRQCWRDEGRMTWKEAGDYFAYVEKPKGVFSMLIYVPLDMIDDNPWQARQEYGDLVDLAERIATARASYPDGLGLMQIPRGRILFQNAANPQPTILNMAKVLTLTDKNRTLMPHTSIRVQLAFGHRRLRAFRHLHEQGEIGYERGVFPLYVGELSDQQMLDAVWAENQQRKDISAVEEAELLARKLEQSGGSQRDVADAWGLARPTVANKLRLLQLPPDVQQANRDGRLAERSCQALLDVQRVQTAVNGSDWASFRKGLYNVMPAAPDKFIATVLEKPDKFTSEDIRSYVQSALQYMGEHIPTVIANHHIRDEQVRQATCKSCPLRMNQHCMDKPCLALKKEAFIADMLAAAAAEWGAPISDTAADFTAFRHQYDDRVQLEKAWRHGIAAAYVVGWQEEGSGLRPYIPDDHTSWIGRSDQFDHDGRAGIVIGVRGGYLSAENLADLAALETQNPDVQAEDIASRALRDAWGKEATLIRQRMEKKAKALLADALYLDIANDERLQALVLPPHTPEMDEHEKFINTLTKFLWEKGAGFSGAYYEWERIAAAETMIARAMLNPALVQPAAATERLRYRAVPLLDYWYTRRTYCATETRERMQTALERLLSTWPTENGDDDLAELHQELVRALRDMKRKGAGDALWQESDDIDVTADEPLTEVAELAEVGVL